MDEKDELKGVDGQPYCGGCKHFLFDPDNTDSHYLLDESTMQGECIFLKDKRIGTTNYSRGCKHWELNKKNCC